MPKLKRTPVLVGVCATAYLLLLGCLGEWSGYPMLIAPFAASATILFGFNQVPAARPKNFVFGHLISSVVGLVMMSFFPGSWIAACVAAGLSIAMMLFTDTGHPPAAGDPILIWASQASWSFLAVPILPAIVLLLGLNWLYLRATRPTH